jgi:cytoskeleton protein RodZ
VTERDIAAGIEEREPPPGMAGALLRAAREAAGMSIDAVAQQLKLAPRQVRALEEGDYIHLPGRTFVRGFVRNYARLVHLDPEKVVGALPAGASAPALEAPMLQQTAQTMGELPTNEHSKSGWTRWAIPLTLAAIVAAAGMYEWLRPQGDSLPTVNTDPAASSERPAPAPAKREASGTSLQNPLVAVAPDLSPTTASSTSAAPPSPASRATESRASPALSPVPTSATVADATTADQSLLLAFRDYSWTEVRDRNGRVLLSGMNSRGTSQTLSGPPPLEVVIGNAMDVSVRYKGQPVDLAPHMRQNVARFTLP